MHMKYALDTNVVFRYLKNESPSVQSINSALAGSHKLYISCSPSVAQL